jgi:hypothetical protein
MSVPMMTPGSRRRRRLAATPAQRILAVEFRSRDGRRWRSIGGGATVTAAIADALAGCSRDAAWDAVAWNDLYGE